MKKLARAEVILTPERRRPRRPKKILDLRKLDAITITQPESPEQAIERLLIFDARCLDKETRQELLRLIPELVHIRRAWRAEYMEQGCTGCQKPDPTIAIAARLRRHGLRWADIYKITATPATTRAERKLFENRVRWRLAHLDAPDRQPSQTYGAGGFCSRCMARIYRRMRNRCKKALQGRNLPAELATFRDALCLRYNTAQRLLRGDE